MKTDYPHITKDDSLINEDKTYVPYESIFGGTSNSGYNVFVGRLDIADLEEEIDKSLRSATKKDTYICRFRTDRRGYYIKNSFSVTPLVFALARIIKEKNVESDSDLNLINKANDEFNDFLMSFNKKFEAKEIREVFNYVVNKLGLENENHTFTALIKPNDSFVTSLDDGLLDEMEDILLERDVPSALKDFLEFETAGHEKKTRSIKREDIIRYSIPTANSYGLWPGKTNTNLTNQVISNSLTDENNVNENGFNLINSMKDSDEISKVIIDIIVDSTVRRAQEMLQYEYPDEAFEEVDFYDNKIYSTSFYKPSELLTQYNTTVIDNKNEFFKDINKKVIDEFENKSKYKNSKTEYYYQNSMPLIFTRIHNSNDVMNLVNNTWKGQEGIKIQLFEETSDFLEEKSKFKKCLDAVKLITEQSQREYEMTQGHERLKERYEDSDKFYKDAQTKHEELEKEKNQIDAKCKKSYDLIDEKESEVKEIEASMPFYKKILSFLFKNDEDIRRVKENKFELEKLYEENKHLEIENQMMIKDFEKSKINLERSKEEVEQLKERLETNTKLIKNYRDKYKKSFADQETLKKIKPNYIDNYSAFWVTKDLNEARSELFLQALKLHKAFGVNSKNVKTNLTVLSLIMEGKLSEEDTKLCYADVVKTLGLVIPVLVIDRAFLPYILSYITDRDLEKAVIPDAKSYFKYDSIGFLRRYKNIIAFSGGSRKEYFPEVTSVVERNIKKRILGEVLDYDVRLNLEELLNYMTNPDDGDSEDKEMRNNDDKKLSLAFDSNESTNEDKESLQETKAMELKF